MVLGLAVLTVLFCVIPLIVAAIGGGMKSHSREGRPELNGFRTSDGSPCPSEVARFLPGGEGVLRIRLQTERHLVTVCETAEGRLFYDGQGKGKPVTDEYHLQIPAQRTADGYIAHRGAYTYEIKPSRLVVTRGEEVLSDSATSPA
ncbi:hypothetical protein [Amycolatopsis decaplanina]|uniref:Uncharacterized protein n=1 Tax=Amycolatopsis decaplanina DSM 44594 TaxID=1284240 RepID=M2YYV9_9PSEU|nr:hypothetical protein [Amycolatopsis decaplanina]EME60107.1 hypothetical protein H074_13807 [Amycolatopsis decaplanina DSM 44594]